ncbi:hypothetical protein PTKIN_Ptkin02bG0239700 [Pterospermum kingtungense]
MALIFEKALDNSDKKEWKISHGANGLPSFDARLNVKDASKEEMMVFDYNVSGRSTPTIGGKDWRNYVARCLEMGVTILSLYKLDDGSYEIKAR